MSPRNFPQYFFERSTVAVARDLLGSLLQTTVGGRTASGIIVEVEAYHETEPAAHSHRGKTARTEVMFGPGGFCYVYFIYGMHYCVNVVTETAGTGAAVLIRALEPVRGISIMERRRGLTGKAVSNGPAKLCEALAINRDMTGENMRVSRKINIKPYLHYKDSEIAITPRIGISKAKDLEWRFYVKDNPWVSK